MHPHEMGLEFPLPRKKEKKLCSTYTAFSNISDFPRMITKWVDINVHFVKENQKTTIEYLFIAIARRKYLSISDTDFMQSALS